MTALEGLRARIAGEIAGPGDEGFALRCSLFNARIEATPAALVGCASAGDVQAALAFAAERQLRVVVRSGAMSDEGTADGGLVVDVSAIDGVEVDPVARIARVGGGVTWGALDEATQEHGLAVTGGRLSRLGVAGVALGSGSGWLERTFGPTSGSIVGAEVVLADGRTVRAGATEHEDLLWALRGGGPGLGVVTQLELGLHPVGPELLSGFLTYPRERVRAVARGYRDLMDAAADQVVGGLALFAGRAGACTVSFAHVGDVAAGEAAVAPLRALRPSLDAVMVNEYRAFQSMGDLQNPFGMRACRSTGFLGELSDDAVEVAVEAANAPAAALSRLLLRPLGGAMGRLDHGALALATTDAQWAYECLSLWPPVPALDAGNVDWVARVDAALAPFTVSAADPRREARLARVRAAYDAGGVFS